MQESPSPTEPKPPPKVLPNPPYPCSLLMQDEIPVPLQQNASVRRNRLIGTPREQPSSKPEIFQVSAPNSCSIRTSEGAFASPVDPYGLALVWNSEITPQM